MHNIRNLERRKRSHNLASIRSLCLAFLAVSGCEQPAREPPAPSPSPPAISSSPAREGFDFMPIELLDRWIGKSLTSAEQLQHMARVLRPDVAPVQHEDCTKDLALFRFVARDARFASAWVDYILYVKDDRVNAIKVKLTNSSGKGRRALKQAPGYWEAHCQQVLGEPLAGDLHNDRPLGYFQCSDHKVALVHDGVIETLLVQGEEHGAPLPVTAKDRMRLMRVPRGEISFEVGGDDVSGVSLIVYQQDEEMLEILSTCPR